MSYPIIPDKVYACVCELLTKNTWSTDVTLTFFFFFYYSIQNGKVPLSAKTLDVRDTEISISLLVYKFRSSQT